MGQDYGDVQSAKVSLILEPVKSRSHQEDNVNDDQDGLPAAIQTAHIQFVSGSTAFWSRQRQSPDMLI